MVILYMVFLLPLTIEAYHLAGYDHYCSVPSTRIRTRADCQAAATALGLNWGNGWWGPGDFAGCLYTRDGRNKVYFNYSPFASSIPNNPDYAEICTGPGPLLHYGLVVTGGDHPFKIASSELISSMGVCVSPNTNIPNLPMITTGAKSVWIQNINILMFCGGSYTFVGHTSLDPYNWGAMNTCLRLAPGDTVWASNPDYNMKVERSWFSMNNINDREAVAAGGITTGLGLGNILDSMEKFSNGEWELLKDNSGADIRLDTARYGHCAVQYNSGSNSFLMIIGGSNNPTNFADATNVVTTINLKTGGNTHLTVGQLPALWAPACTKNGGDIYVSGGGRSGYAYKDVYKGTILGNFIEIGSGLSTERSGHTMGFTSTGQLFVAGGYDPSKHGHDAYLKEIETSVDDGETWNTLTTKLKEGGEYAAMASVPAASDPASSFMCLGVPNNSG